jgi:hypothetical protein
MLQKFRAWRERRKRQQEETDQELREEEEDAEKHMGIDPAEFHTKLGEAESAPWRRGILTRRFDVDEPAAAPPDEKPD